MEDFNIVKIDGKPIEKLIEVVSNAIGTLYEPRQLVRIARAEAEAEYLKKLDALVRAEEQKNGKKRK